MDARCSAACGPRDIITRAALENAIAVGRRHRRIDQRRAASAGDRAARRASRSTLDDFDRDQRAGAAARRSQAVRAGSSRPTCTRAGGTPLVVAAAASRRARIDGDAVDRHRPDASARKPRRPSKRPARRSCGRCDRPLKPHRRPGDSPRQPRARGRVVKVAGHRPRARTAGRRACSTARKRRSRRSSSRRSAPATSSSSATKGPSGGPGHARDARRHGGDRRRRPGRIGGARDRRPLLRRDARPDGRPRRARRRPPAARSPPSATATSSSIDVAKRRLDVERRDDEIAARLADVDGAGAAVHDRRDGEVRAAGVVGVEGAVTG